MARRKQIRAEQWEDAVAMIRSTLVVLPRVLMVLESGQQPLLAARLLAAHQLILDVQDALGSVQGDADTRRTIVTVPVAPRRRRRAVAAPPEAEGVAIA
jgi:hypothetical protein